MSHCHEACVGEWNVRARRHVSVGEGHACAITKLSVVVCLEVQLRDVCTVAAGGGDRCIKFHQPIIQTESAIGKAVLVLECWRSVRNSTEVCLNRCVTGVCDDQDNLDDTTARVLWALVLWVFTVMNVWRLFLGVGL